jgi:hypothetical protein
MLLKIDSTVCFPLQGRFHVSNFKFGCSHHYSPYSLLSDIVYRLSLYVLRLATSLPWVEVGRNEFEANFVYLSGNPFKILAGSTFNFLRQLPVPLGHLLKSFCMYIRLYASKQFESHWTEFFNVIWYWKTVDPFWFTCTLGNLNLHLTWGPTCFCAFLLSVFVYTLFFDVSLTVHLSITWI